MSILSREQFAEFGKRRYVEVELPQGKVRLQSLTEMERGDFNAEMLDDEGKVDKESTKAGTAKLLVRMIVDEQGILVFHANEWPVIAAWDSLITEQLGDAARKHIGFDRDNEKKS